MSCLRYELKNSFFKRCAHIVCNLTNMSHSCTSAPTVCPFFSTVNNNVRKGVIVKNYCVSVGSLAYCQAMCNKFEIEPTQGIAVSETVTAASVGYRIGHLVILPSDFNSGDPVLGMVSGFVSLTGDDTWYIVCESVKTKVFNSHFQAYPIEFMKQSVFSVHRFIDLADQHPLSQQTRIGGSHMVNTCHRIWGPYAFAICVAWTFCSWYVKREVYVKHICYSHIASIWHAYETSHMSQDTWRSYRRHLRLAYGLRHMSVRYHQYWNTMCLHHIAHMIPPMSIMNVGVMC